MKKKALAALFAAVMLFALTACSVSSTSTSTTTVSTSITDENGNTTTNTVTNEVGISAGTDGVSTTNQTTTTTTTSNNTGVTSDELKGALAQKFSAGSEGVSAAGDKILFAYDDPEVFSYGAIIIVSDGGQSLMGREGEITYAGEQWKLLDMDMGDEIPFVLTDTDIDDELSFVMTFQDGDSAVMTAVDAETVINDMIATLAEFHI